MAQNSDVSKNKSVEIEFLTPVSGPPIIADPDQLTIRRGKTRTFVRGSRKHSMVTNLGPAAIALAAILISFVIPIAEARLLTQVVSLTVILWGLDVQLGAGGQLSLGHGAFVGIGAYAAAISLGTLSWSFPLALLAAAVCGFLAGAIVGLPAMRIGGQYLAMVTLGLAVSFPFVIRRFAWLTGGANGPVIDYQFVPPDFLGLTAKDFHLQSHALICVIALGTYFVVRRIISGKLGRIIRAVADDPSAATAFGLRPGVVRSTTVALSAAIAGVGGALLTFASPGAVSSETYNLQFSLSLYAAAVFGGIGTLLGSLLGSILLVLTPWVARYFGFRFEPEMIAGLVLLSFTLASKNRGVAHLISQWSRDRFVLIEPEEHQPADGLASDSGPSEAPPTTR